MVDANRTPFMTWSYQGTWTLRCAFNHINSIPKKTLVFHVSVQDIDLRFSRSLSFLCPIMRQRPSQRSSFEEDVSDACSEAERVLWVRGLPPRTNQIFM
jgi:hypothetical protein